MSPRLPAHQVHESGRTAGMAILANDVLIPEVPFALDGPAAVLDHLHARVHDRGHGRFVHIPMALAVSRRNQATRSGDSPG